MLKICLLVFFVIFCLSNGTEPSSTGTKGSSTTSGGSSTKGSSTTSGGSTTKGDGTTTTRSQSTSVGNGTHSKTTTTKSFTTTNQVYTTISGENEFFNSTGGGGGNGEFFTSGGGDNNGEGSTHTTSSNGEGSIHTTSSNGEGSIHTTSSSSGISGFSDHTCEKDQEPSGECSLLLEVLVETQYALTNETQIFAVFKDAWQLVASLSSYGVSSISLYVELLVFDVYGNKNRRALLMSGESSSGKSSESSSGSSESSSSETKVTTTQAGTTSTHSSTQSGTTSTHSSTQSGTTTTQSGSTTDSHSSTQSHSSTTGSSDTTTTGSSGTTTTSSGTTTTSSSGTTSSSTYSYSYNVSVALFEGSCTDVGLFYDYFSTLASDFTSYINEYIDSESKVYSNDGFGDTSILSITLSERSDTGSVISSTTFTSTSPGCSFTRKSIILAISSLCLICISFLL